MDLRRRQILGGLLASPFTSVTWATAFAEAPRPLTLVARPGDAPGGSRLRYGEVSPGPVLRLPHGMPCRLSLENALDRPTSLDLHGLRLPLPGAPGPLGTPLAPGGSSTFTFTPPDSGTLWFHPWALDPAHDDTAAGLAGALVIEEPAPPAADMDRVAIVTDDLVSPPSAGAGDGDAPLRIDGRPVPATEVLRPGARVRLRLINASTRRALAARITGATPSVIAIDGQPSELFRPRADTLPIGPGARFDLLFDLPAQEGEAARLMLATGGFAGAALVFEARGDPLPSRGPLAALPSNPALPTMIRLEAAARVNLVARGSAGADASWSLNGAKAGALAPAPLFAVRRGRAVTLAFQNESTALVGFRLHGFVMRLLHDLDDGWEPYWRDTILVPPGATHHAAFLADLPGRWLIESPFFAQSAKGLRGWFEVT